MLNEASGTGCRAGGASSSDSGSANLSSALDPRISDSQLTDSRTKAYKTGLTTSYRCEDHSRALMKILISFSRGSTVQEIGGSISMPFSRSVLSLCFKSQTWTRSMLADTIETAFRLGTFHRPRCSCSSMMRALDRAAFVHMESAGKGKVELFDMGAGMNGR